MRVELPATAAADHGVVGVQVLLVVLGKELARTVFNHFEDSLLVLKAFFAELMHDCLYLALDQLEDAWLHLRQEALRDVTHVLLGLLREAAATPLY